tara:strand:- start:426 stop:671 length:246 start_codon:yes stop_codon:yes gene_type:complete
MNTKCIITAIIAKKSNRFKLPVSWKAIPDNGVKGIIIAEITLASFDHAKAPDLLNELAAIIHIPTPKKNNKVPTRYLPKYI